MENKEQKPWVILPELKVLNFKKSIEWYTERARFRIEYERPEHEFAMLTREGARLMIESVSDKSRTFNVGTTEHPFGRGIHFQIQVADVQALYDHFKQCGQEFFLEMEEKWYRRNDVELGNRQFLVQDPDGYLFRFFQDLGERKVNV